jgi:hypothetical protein
MERGGAIDMGRCDLPWKQPVTAILLSGGGADGTEAREEKIAGF